MLARRGRQHARALDRRGLGGRRQRRGRVQRRARRSARGAAEARASQTLFNTHWHLEQVGANEALGAAGRDDRRAREDPPAAGDGYYLPHEDRYEKPLPAAAQPDARPSTGGHDRRSATSGSSTATCSRRTRTATSMCSFRDANVRRGRRRRLAAAGSRARLVRRRLARRPRRLARAALELGDADTRIVPSYGPVVGRAEVQAELDMMRKLFDRMVELVRIGERAARHAGCGRARRARPDVRGPAKFSTTRTRATGRITTR